MAQPEEKKKENHDGGRTYDMHKKGDGQFTGEVQRLIPRARAGKRWEINGVKCYSSSVWWTNGNGRISRQPSATFEKKTKSPTLNEYKRPEPSEDIRSWILDELYASISTTCWNCLCCCLLCCSCSRKPPARATTTYTNNFRPHDMVQMIIGPMRTDTSLISSHSTSLTTSSKMISFHQVLHF